MENSELNNKIEGGIDLARLINKEYLTPLGDFYKCNICNKIMINPTDCENCGHSFCYECISKTKCPFNCEKKNLKPASNGITNLLNNLKFKCVNEGCDEIINYIDIKSHQNLCPYQKMICPNKECNEQILKKNLEKHIKDECKYTNIKCENCGNNIPRYQIQEHEKMCNLANQSINSSNSILNISGNNLNNNGGENNINLIQKFKENIVDILKDDNNIQNKNENQKESNPILNTYYPTKSDTLNSIINNSNKNNNNIFNEQNQEEKNNNILNENNNIFNNFNQNDSMDNNNINELSHQSLKQSTAQIEEDDLIYILKKAIEEKLNDRFINFDSNIDKILNDIKTIKTFVCKVNNTEKNKNFDEKNLDDKLNNIKEYLKELYK